MERNDGSRAKMHTIPNYSPIYSKKTSITSPKEQSIHDMENIRSRKETQISNMVKNHEQMKNIRDFVEEVAADPSILHKLIDYQQLNNQMQEEIKEIQAIMQQSKNQLKNLKKNYEEMIGNGCGGVLDRVKQSERQAEEEIEKFKSEIQELKKRRSLRKQEQLNKQIKLSEKIKENKKNGRIQIKIIQQRIKDQQYKKSHLLEKIKIANRETEKLRQKFTKNDMKKVDIVKITEQLASKRTELGEIRKKQTQQLKKYKQSLMLKKNNELQLKKESQRRLQKFVSELQKIINSYDRNIFTDFVKCYETKISSKKDMQVQNNKVSEKYDEKPLKQYNSAQKQRETELSKMEDINPTLKQNRMNIRSITQKINISQMTPQAQVKNKLAYETLLAQLQTNLKKLISEEQSIDELISSLREKLNKTQSQLKEIKAPVHPKGLVINK